MKIAIIALPSSKETLAMPPLSVGYVAALFEQQRHILRIYDLALEQDAPPAKTLAAVQAFKPHAILVASDDSAQADALRRELRDCDAAWIWLGTSLRGALPAEMASQALRVLDAGDTHAHASSHAMIAATMLVLREQLDTLPFPARHLLRLEQYRLATPAGSLQTNILVGQLVDGRALLRNPRLIIAELRSIIHDYGIWHFVFDGPPLTSDLPWLNEFLYDLVVARLGISWEATVDPRALTPELLSLSRRAGCELLNIAFDAIQVLDSTADREALVAIVHEAHAHEILVRGHVLLDPRYSSIPAVVDMSATFGLDEARFSVQHHAQESQTSVLPGSDQLVTLAQSRYRTLQGRQLLINRFGAYLGPMIWRAGRVGLLNRFWRRTIASDVA